MTFPSLQIALVLSSILFLALPFHGNSESYGEEHAILLKLKQHWSNPPSINHWTPSSSNSNSTHCDWPEITCTKGSISGLALINISGTGTIPPFICDLKNLSILDLQYNYFPGPFPKFFYNCSKLEHLDLFHNFFVGSIPDDVDELSPQLRYLNLGANNFTGDIPAAIGNLSKLEVLDMSYNDFTPLVIPSSLFQLKNIKKLYMQHLKLIGEIPEAIRNLTTLEILDLSMNDLTGNIPSGLFLLKDLKTLFLFNNHLYGMIPPLIEALNLEKIDLSGNNLTGTIPDDFGRLKRLSLLSLFSNQLSSQVPESIGRLRSLRDVKLFNNNLSGTLPPDFGRYSMLTEFDVSSNHFTGKLPEYLCANRVLVEMVAFHNNLSGELPNSFGNCRSLSIVWIHGNQLSGRIPAGLWESENLKYLNVSDNSFMGQLPDIRGWNHLSQLDISNNKFFGEIPTGVANWNFLSVFQASNNLFSGSIPQELTGLSFITTLLLDRNQLSGHLPSNITFWTSLTTLNLSQNKLSGPIPAEISYLPVRYLDLSKNEFSGQIPPEFSYMKLTSLNFSSNHLTGRIPIEFEIAIFNASFLNNLGLCASNPLLGLNVCSSRPRNWIKISSHLFAIVASIAAISFVLAVLLMFFIVRVYRKRNLGKILTWNLTPFQMLDFTESDIVYSLTENNVIGRGGSGKVYRVAINGSGIFVAVKSIWNSKKLDQRLEKEFLAEIQILGTIRHSNIVKLLCCIASENSKLLVYEFLEYHSLDRWLHGKKQPIISDSVHRVVLDWPKRLQIAVGAARGLCYMHHDCSPSLIHRDVKSSNILLDSQFNAKIADFGLAKILVKKGEPNTMSTVAGTFGYIAPEYAHTSRVNEKIDVYSFGVVLLELVTGKEAINRDEDMCLAEWAWQHIQEGNPIVDALDEEVKEACYLDEMIGVFKLGIICTGTFPSTRPSMKEVLQILLGCSQQLPLRENNAGSNYGAAPLHTNSSHESMLEDDGNDWAYIMTVE